MGFIFWRKYEDSWLATAISFVGFFLALLGAIFFGIFCEKTFNLEPGGLVEFAIIIATAIVLKILLNLLTDWIAKKILAAKVDHIDKKLEKEKVKQQNLREKALDRIHNTTEQDALLKALLKEWPLTIPDDDFLKESDRLNDEHLNELIGILDDRWKIQGNPRYFRKEGNDWDQMYYKEVKIITQLISMVKSINRRNELEKTHSYCYAAMAILK